MTEEEVEVEVAFYPIDDIKAKLMLTICVLSRVDNRRGLGLLDKEYLRLLEGRLASIEEMEDNNV